MICEPIRILHVFGRLDIAGAETFIMNVYRNIDRSKVQFDFMLHTIDKCAYDDEVAALGGKIFRIPKYKILNHLKYKKEWHKFFRNNKTHKMIHGHMTSTAAIYLKVAKKYGITTISHAHNASLGKDFMSKIKDVLQLPLKHTTDYLFACSTVAGKWCYGKNVCEKNHFYIIRNAVDTEKFVYAQNVRESKRKELGIENKFVIIHIGRFEPPKNHDFLVNIYKTIYEKNHDTVLLLVGDGPLRGDIEKKVNHLGLKNNIIFTGIYSDIPAILCAADVFLFPSLSEGLGMVLIEAQTNGLHCIASDTVPGEAQITDLLEYISLIKSPIYWADKVLAYAKGYERKDMQEEVKKAGFDINKGSKWLEDFYYE
jgi:glycosyltransferase involved in cell wall biosynthesis